MASMFNNCDMLKDVPVFNTSSVTNFNNMFYGCYSLKVAPAFDTHSGTSFNSMFSTCHSLEEIPQYDISHATDVSMMFSACNGLEYIDISSYDFSSVTNAGSFLNNAYLIGGGNLYLPGINKFPVAGIPVGSSTSSATFGVNAGSSDYAAYNAVNIIITEDSGMIPVQGNAKNAFGSSQYGPFVYVPDSLYATYTANSNWSQLGTRLRKISDLPA
jgi:surface protein